MKVCSATTQCSSYHQDTATFPRCSSPTTNDGRGYNGKSVPTSPLSVKLGSAESAIVLSPMQSSHGGNAAGRVSPNMGTKSDKSHCLKEQRTWQSPALPSSLQTTNVAQEGLRAHTHTHTRNVGPLVVEKLNRFWEQ